MRRPGISISARLGVTMLLFSAVLPAQVTPDQWRPPASDSPQRPRTSCTSLRSLTGYEFSIITATVQPAVANAPEICRVIGQVQPEIRFEVVLPAEWNGRLLMTGNGGYAGEDIEAPNRAGPRNEALRMGFVAVQTNTGHDASVEPLGAFAVNSQKLLDYAFRAVHVTAETAKRLASAYYGAAPTKSYFQGCSTGGRQALISAQRFPTDFDGIVAGAPVLDFTGTMLKYVSWIQATEAAPLTSAKLKLLSDRIYAQCDARDGVQDGLIDDPRRCGFQPSRDLPKCSGADGPECFTEPQIRALDVLYSDLVVNGKRLHPGLPVGAEVTGPNGRSGFDGWVVRDNGQPTWSLFSETFFRFLAFPRKDPSLTLKQVDLERDAPRLQSISQTLDATDPDLSAFRDRGGKLLMYFGWADSALNAQVGVDYYEAVLKKMGPDARQFFRLYMVPGMFHCSGGVGCDSFPKLSALIPWVEEGKTPEALPAARLERGKPVRTRPLCPYPEQAKYAGSGSIDEAANFRCVAP